MSTTLCTLIHVLENEACVGLVGRVLGKEEARGRHDNFPKGTLFHFYVIIE